MGVQITTSGKLRGDRSSFEKHSKGILPRAGHFADVIVSEDIVHVQTKMGLIGVRIRIAIKERYIPEFELRAMKKEVVPAKPPVIEEKEIEVIEEIPIDPTKPSTESELIEIEEKLVDLGGFLKAFIYPLATCFFAILNYTKMRQVLLENKHPN